MWNMASAKLLSNGLTPKQTRVTQALLKQIRETGNVNYTKAGREVLNVNSDNTAAVGVREILRNPQVKQTIQEALEEAGLTPTLIAGEIRHLAAATVEKVTADVKLRSLVEILKLTGAYPTQKHANISLSVKANLSNMKYEDLESEMSRIDGELKQLVEKKA